MGLELLKGALEFGVDLGQVGLEFPKSVLCLSELDEAQGLETGQGAEVDRHGEAPYWMMNSVNEMLAMRPCWKSSLLMLMSGGRSRSLSWVERQWH